MNQQAGCDCMARSTLFVGLLFPALAMAGCLETPALPIDPELLPHGHEGMTMDFRMEATNCEEGGFVAAYSGTITYPGGWKSADIREEVGNPLHDGLGLPVLGPLYGNWHMGYRCESATAHGVTEKGFIFGRVGQMIEAPAFDPGGADFHFISTGFAMANGTIGDGLRDVTTADITQAYNTYVTWYLPKELPRSAAYVLFSDIQKGVYEGVGDMEFYRDFEPRTIRFWWIVPADGSDAHGSDHHGEPTGPVTGADGGAGEYNPVFWDITTTGGEQYTTPPAGVEVGFHNRGLEGISEHGVPTQPMLNTIYQHKSLTLTYGHVIKDVIITETWTH
jgi:hypothetical protein